MSGGEIAYASPRVSMRHPDRWLAVLRIVVGLWFLKAIVSKVAIGMLAGVIPVPEASARWLATMPRLLERYAAANPFPAYRAFLLDVAAPHPVFAHLTALGESAVGLSLTLGLLTRVGAGIGLAQVVLYGLAVQHMSSGQRGFHVLLLAAMTAFLAAGAGRTWGIDGWLARHHAGSRLTRTG